MLTHHAFSPIHASMESVEDWSLEPPLSNGPFRISAMGEDAIVFERSEQYWDAGGVPLSRITARFADDDEASALWNSGVALWILGGANIDALTDRSGITVHALFGAHFFFVRSGEPPLDDWRVRRALSLALPWAEIRSAHFIPARSLVNPLPGYPRIDGVGETDAAEAARLLAQAGFPGGAGMPELVVRITPSADSARIAALMAGAWAALGVSARAEVVPFGEYYGELDTGGYHLGTMSWIGGFPDPFSFLMNWVSDSNLNTAGLSDGDYDALVARSMSEQGAARMATLAEAEQLLLDRGVILPVSFLPAVNIIDTNELEGWFPNALGIHPFRHISFRELRPLPGVAMGL
jgi:peptide/nickel transport system substrate-binding protein/oligopeptide transport system substrate-binding protein